MSTKAFISRGKRTGIAAIVTSFFFLNLTLLTAQAHEEQNPRGRQNSTPIDRSSADGADDVDAAGSSRECRRQLASFESGRSDADATGYIETYELRTPEGGRGYDGL